MWVSWLMMLLSLWPVASSDAKPGCQEKCGNVSVPYPFGILEPSCAMNDNFFLNCTSNNELLFGNMPISDISQQEGTVTVGIYAAFNCYTKTGIETDSFSQSMTLAGPFMLSHTRNIFTATGCDTFAEVTNSESTYGAACLSLCTEYVEMSDANPCSADTRSLKISDWQLSRTPKYGKDAYATDVVIEWVVKNETCEQAKADASAYACGTNANCTYPESGQGYRCSCNEGFQGNPYLQEGCQGKLVIVLWLLCFEYIYAFEGLPVVSRHVFSFSSGIL
ncbi:hypothetical protein OIU79_021837 [Salix purpurea]|uniref:Wall-associated receptor kinase galacturonan-binding domain-containing protein n=1 Tax=Salix purpurea TaxID=77065 RepID=A0A9Q0WHG4_SALPP|nr:hypothetical protein OIU79_021837 [Salix purpurea]